MDRPIRFRPLIALSLLALAPSTGCDDTKVEPLSKPVPAIDDRVTLRGQVCTRPPDPSGFPVKVLFLVDRSGSMCVTDPPGSQGTGAMQNALCENFNAAYAGGTGPINNYCETDSGDVSPHPGRVCAIYQLLEQFKNQPNVQAALVPFDVTVSGYYPDPSMNGGFGFAPVTDANFGSDTSDWNMNLNAMQGALGNGTDYEGAFAEAYERIATDIALSPKAQRPRTRYVLVFLTDGVPFPRCTADPSLPAQDYNSPSNPDGIWPNSPGAGCPGTPNSTSMCKGMSYPNSGCFCTADQAYIDCELGQPGAFTPGTDRNQDYQIYNQIDQIMGLQKLYDIADLNIHSILLWNWGNIATLSLADQQDLFGDVGFTNPVQAEHDDAVHLLQEISLVHGNGTYQEYSDVASIQLGALDYTSLISPYVIKNFLVQNINARPGVPSALVDTDGEGLPDSLDNSFTAGTNKFKPDTDGDGFDDYFEYTHEQEGFDPAAANPRGCLPTADTLPAPGYACGDTDGDGLSAAAELYLKTDSTLDDSDTDGIPDGLEVAYGLNPAVADDPLADTDGDGTPDMQEVRIHSDPMVADSEYQAEHGYNYEITVVPQDGGTGITCYDFSVSNVQMVTTQSANGVEEGYNMIRLLFDEAPASNISNDYGLWREACVITQYAPPTLRVPAGPTVDIADSDFYSPDQIPGAPGPVSPTQIPKCVTPAN